MHVHVDGEESHSWDSKQLQRRGEGVAGRNPGQEWRYNGGVTAEELRVQGTEIQPWVEQLEVAGDLVPDYLMRGTG